MDDTKRFISRQNVSLLSRMIGYTFQQARDRVVDWLQRHRGYVSSLGEANESLIAEVKGLSQRPRSDIKINQQDESQTISDRLQQMQQERTAMTERRPPPQTMQENTIIKQESREESLKLTSQRLEEMQRMRSAELPIPKPEDHEPTEYSVPISTMGNRSVTIVFHSTHAERKQGQEWWERIWNVPELHTMAIAQTLEVPYIYIETMRRSNMRRCLLQISGPQREQSSSESWILTPSQTKKDSVREYKVVEEIQDESGERWTYHLEPTRDDASWQWGGKTDRVQASIVPMNMGYVWSEEDVVSWSVIMRWKR